MIPATKKKNSEETSPVTPEEQSGMASLSNVSTTPDPVVFAKLHGRQEIRASGRTLGKRFVPPAGDPGPHPKGRCRPLTPNQLLGKAATSPVPGRSSEIVTPKYWKDSRYLRGVPQTTIIHPLNDPHHPLADEVPPKPPVTDDGSSAFVRINGEARLLQPLTHGGHVIVHLSDGLGPSGLLRRQ
ncbi:hypothetical protein J437_LFUL010125 [Ladona fulva]|uniref:Uncharacterized protein n=1 Tax=Ladona fulva TaxID=123851 RepID=A0A8K0P4S0_LADFU|nr:hypothetical protein J437_LFUL010125 [Ladona fulva]